MSQCVLEGSVSYSALLGVTVGEREMQGLRTPHSAALRGSTRVRTTREAGGQREWQSLSTQQAVLGV